MKDMKERHDGSQQAGGGSGRGGGGVGYQSRNAVSKLEQRQSTSLEWITGPVSF